LLLYEFGGVEGKLLIVQNPDDVFVAVANADVRP
jgi:hypothetical protein